VDSPSIDVDFEAVERLVAHAIRSGNTSSVNLLGHGEVSIVIGWPTAKAEHAVKRIPPFRSEQLARQYVECCERAVSLLRAGEVSVWPTSFHVLRRDDGQFVVFHRQPVADAATTGDNVLRAAPPADQHPLIDAIVDAAASVVRPRVGLDCQASNWIWDGQTAAQIDFSSPFLLNDTGDDLEFDTKTFLREFPVALRPYLRRELIKIVRRFTTPEGAIGDMVAMLMKEGLDQWVEPVCQAALDRHGLAVNAARSREMLNEDLKLFPLTLKLKKAQRRWMHTTGRRYESLLPATTTYER
jgi:hypothetical protein